MGQVDTTADTSKQKLTTFIIPSVDRPTLQRAIDSVNKTGANYLVEIDKQKIGASAIRNGLIKLANTKWVSFLDDDDTVTDDYVERLHEESQKHPEADVIIFREYFIADLMDETGSKYGDHFIWQAPVVHWGQIGISFSVKRNIAMQHPFLEEDNEDFKFVKRLEDAGYNIHFSKYIVYRARH